MKGDNSFAVKNIRLEDIYGENYLSKITGKTRIGSTASPISSTTTDFTGGTMIAVYKETINGGWKLLTMYPNPTI